jgi:hypothetical protein
MQPLKVEKIFKDFLDKFFLRLGVLASWWSG